jgi:hypothetical protein
MPLFYPAQRFGRFGLAMGLTSALLHERFGLDFGERFHRDILFRVSALMEIDRLVWEAFGGLGLGYEEPFPRATIEPFGHRFVPVLYGSDCAYSSAEEPAARHRELDPAQLASLPGWTPERFEALDAVREVTAQARIIRERYGDRLGDYAVRMGYNPHYQPLSSLQNLGSVINTAVSVFGESILLLYEDDPALLRTFYRNVTDLMLLSLDRFPKQDGRRLDHVFVGDCTVAMISPRQYAACNLAFDQELSRYAASLGAEFLVHQDSAVTAHLSNYARLEPVGALDVGQDTDFTEAARLFPDAAASCILFPSWIASTPAGEMEAELTRLMRAGRRFRSFTFSIFEVDPALAAGKINDFHEVFRRCAETVSREEIL